MCRPASSGGLVVAAVVVRSSAVARLLLCRFRRRRPRQQINFQRRRSNGPAKGVAVAARWRPRKRPRSRLGRGRSLAAVALAHGARCCIAAVLPSWPREARVLKSCGHVQAGALAKRRRHGLPRLGRAPQCGQFSAHHVLPLVIFDSCRFVRAGLIILE